MSFLLERWPFEQWPLARSDSPGPSLRRIKTWPSFNGVSDDVSAKRSAWASSGVLSTLEMHRLMAAGLCGGGTESARIRPREGSSESMATFDGISQLLA